jgi:hypothetical protein
MSIQTIDDAIYAASETRAIEKKPFTSKLWHEINDSNSGGAYTNPQLVFETSYANNSGYFLNFPEAYLSFPMIGCLSGKSETPAAGANPAVPGGTAINCGQSFLDYVMGLKNCAAANIIHSITIEHENKVKFTCASYANQYMNFLLNTTMSDEDVKLYGPTIGYAKDNSDSWGYANAANQNGQGLYNNLNNKMYESDFINGSTMNDGFLKRQNHFMRTVYDPANVNTTRDKFLTGDETKRKDDAVNCIVDEANKKYFFYDCIVPLKHLCPSLFGYDGLGMIRGANIRITVTLNAMVDFNFSKLSSGGINPLYFHESTFRNQSASETNMWMVAAGTQEMAKSTALNDPTAHANPVLIDNGSSLLPLNTGGATDAAGNLNCYSFSARLCKLDTKTHGKARCTLNIPSYTIQPSMIESFLKQRQKEITVLNIWYKMFTSSGPIQETISNSIVRPKRLIMIAQVAKPTDNGEISVLKSPFFTSCGHTCPFSIINFQITVGTRQVYQNTAHSYTYENFVNELNGAQGLNGGQTPGLSSGQINFKDFNGLYHYLVVDLSRKEISNEKQAVTIEVKGQLQSAVAMNFHCYLEYAETYYVDISNGAMSDGTSITD